MAFIAYYENNSTGGTYDQKFNNRTESAARIAALKLETKHRKLVRLEAAKPIAVKRAESANARIKRLSDMMHQLRTDFGGSKYNEVAEDVVVRIAEHCKNPHNDGKFNYGSSVLSFTIMIWGDQFKGQGNEWDITEMTYSQAKAFIKAKVAARLAN